MLDAFLGPLPAAKAPEPPFRLVVHSMEAAWWLDKFIASPDRATFRKVCNDLLARAKAIGPNRQHDDMITDVLIALRRAERHHAAS